MTNDDDTVLVWSDELGGDQRRKNKNKGSKDNSEVDESSLELHIRRLTSGKGRTILEIKNLPANKSWCKKLAKEIKQKLGLGGAYKKDFIEVHGDNLTRLTDILDQKKLRWKKTGG